MDVEERAGGDPAEKRPADPDFDVVRMSAQAQNLQGLPRLREHK